MSVGEVWIRKRRRPHWVADSAARLNVYSGAGTDSFGTLAFSYSFSPQSGMNQSIMNRRISLCAVWMLAVCTSSAAETDSAATVCGGFDATLLTEGKPLIRVEPVVGAELREDDIDSCVVVTYGLEEKRGTDGAALLAHKPKAVAKSDDVTKKEMKAAERALSKWLFLAKTHDASKESIYYSLIIF